MRTPPTAAWDGSWQMGTTGHTGDLLMLSKLRTLSGTTAIAAAAAIVGLTDVRNSTLKDQSLLLTTAQSSAAKIQLATKTSREQS